MTEKESLRELLAERSFWIYTDGSASTSGVRSGSYSAMILEDNVPHRLVTGAFTETTINRMELTAINAALFRVRELLGGVVHGVKVRVVTDSELTQKAIIGENKRVANLDLWAQFDALLIGFEEVVVIHNNRNVEPPQIQVDAICDFCRREHEALVSRILRTHAFQLCEITKKTKLSA